MNVLDVNLCDFIVAVNLYFDKKRRTPPAAACSMTVFDTYVNEKGC